MRSQFDSPMGIEDGVAKACGELGWEGAEVEAIVTVTITQKNQQLVGTASSPPNFDAPEIVAAAGKSFDGIRPGSSLQKHFFRRSRGTAM